MMNYQKNIKTLFMLYVFIAMSLYGCFANAQNADFPNKPIRIIVTTPPGSGGDTIARAIAQGLSEINHQQHIVENRVGAGGIIGAQAISAATPDGYTIGIAVTSHVVAPLLQAKPPYHPLNDFTPIAQLTVIPNIVVSSLKNNVKSFKDLIELAKAKPSEINYGSLGDGTAAHLAAEIVNRATKMKVTHIPYRSIADSYTGLWSGDVQYVVYLTPSAIPLFQGGKAIPLAITSKTRNPNFPDIPTVREMGYPEAESELTVGLVGPAKMPSAIVQKIHDDVIAAMRLPDIQEKLIKQGGQPSTDVSSKQYDTRLREEYEMFKKLISTLGIKQQ
jgi:tripartite-type tricarboxylate transporter receptor subunit TctC